MLSLVSPYSDRQVNQEDEQQAAAAFIQRTWRAFREHKRYLTLMILVDMAKLRLLQRLCRSIVRQIRAQHRRTQHQREEQAEKARDENTDDDEVGRRAIIINDRCVLRPIPRRAQAVISELYAINRDVSNLLVLLKSDPMGILARAAPGKSMKLLRSAPPELSSSPFRRDDDSSDEDNGGVDGNVVVSKRRLRRGMSLRQKSMGRRVKEAVQNET
eukprot:scaffold41706_cov29-Prasinocladus_malaysianus.AAC.1